MLEDFVDLTLLHCQYDFFKYVYFIVSTFI